MQGTWLPLQRYLSGCFRRSPADAGRLCLPCSLPDWDVLPYSASLGLLFFTFSKKPRPTSSPESLPEAPTSSSPHWFCLSAWSLPRSCVCCFHPPCALPVLSVTRERRHCGRAAACSAPGNRDHSDRVSHGCSAGTDARRVNFDEAENI